MSDTPVHERGPRGVIYVLGTPKPRTPLFLPKKETPTKATK